VKRSTPALDAAMAATKIRDGTLQMIIRAILDIPGMMAEQTVGTENSPKKNLVALSLP
jgi:hypothetical protein